MLPGKGLLPQHIHIDTANTLGWFMGAAVILTHFSHLETMLVSNNLDMIFLKKKKRKKDPNFGHSFLLWANLKF